MAEVTKGIIEYSKKLDGENFFYINGRKSNFKIKEFACKDGSDKILVDCELVEKLQIMRKHFGRPLIINSAYRTIEHNKAVGGACDSRHLFGTAADIYISGVTMKEIADFAKAIDFRGVGTYKNFVHVDVRANYSYWNG